MARPFIPFPQGASCELIGYCNSNFVENIFHVEHLVHDFTAYDLLVLRNIAIAWVTNYYSYAYSNSCFIVRIRSKSLHSQTGPVDDYELPVPIGGQVSEAPLPNNVTFCSKLLTGLIGRSQRGRWYSIGMCSVQTDGNDASAAYASGMRASLEALRTAIPADANPMRMVVASYRTNKAWRSVVSSHPVTEISITDTHLDSQRRRLTGRGRV